MGVDADSAAVCGATALYQGSSTDAQTWFLFFGFPTLFQANACSSTPNDRAHPGDAFDIERRGRDIVVVSKLQRSEIFQRVRGPRDGF